jgi:hypothetical protein
MHTTARAAQNEGRHQRFERRRDVYIVENIVTSGDARQYGMNHVAKGSGGLSDASSVALAWMNELQEILIGREVPSRPRKKTCSRIDRRH